MDSRIDLDRARRDAKELLRAARAGEKAAMARLRSDRAPRLADAQHAVARNLGETSWPALLRRVETELDAEIDVAVDHAFAGRHTAALACVRGRRSLIRRLRRARSDVLLRAARENNAAATNTLLELGVDPNVRDGDSGRTALHLAAACGALDVVSRLVTWVPVDRRALDRDRESALDACVRGASGARAERDLKGYAAVAKVLVANGLAARADVLAAATGPVAEWLAGHGKTVAVAPAADAALGEAACALEVAWATALSRSPLAERRAVGDGFAFRTGLFDNTRNGVVCSRLPDDSTDDVIGELIDWFDAAGAPALWLVDASTEPSNLGERLERKGCRAERTGVYMAAALDRLAYGEPQPDGLDIATVRSSDELAASVRAVDESDEVEQRDREVAVLASLGLGDDGPVRHYAARHAGATVGLATLFVDGRAAELINLDVVARWRRHGIGRALTLHAFAEARRAGCTVGVLAPTAASVPFYEALGFVLRPVPPDRSYYLPLTER